MSLDQFSFDRNFIVPFFAITLFAMSCGENSEKEDGPPMTPDEIAALQDAVNNAGGKADGSGLIYFETSYVNMALAGKSEKGDVALIAGTHKENFPYWGTKPWDNGLLMVGDKQYHFTHRVRGESLSFQMDLNRQKQLAYVVYKGVMFQASDNASVEIEFKLPVVMTRHLAHDLGRPIPYLMIKVTPGMVWRPYSIGSAVTLEGEIPGEIRIDGGDAIQVTGMNGELENGILKNVRAPEFAIAYDYISVAKPGPTGYGFVDFVSHSLFDDGALGRTLDWLSVKYASRSLTVTSLDYPYLGNAYWVNRPSQSDEDVVLFENQVDLGLATLHRQMIRTTDYYGDYLYGLREIFVAK